MRQNMKTHGEHGEPREPTRVVSRARGTRHEALAYPTAAVAVMEFLREDARAMHEDTRTETVVDGRDEENMATAAAAVSFGHIDG